MPNSISIGYPQVIADNVPRALPGRKARLFITAGTATSIDISNNADMSGAKNSVVATGAAFSESGVDVAAGFLRVNGGTATVRLTT